MENTNVSFIDWGLIEYEKAVSLQEGYFQEILQLKSQHSEHRPNYLIFCEHNHVYTLGKSGSIENLLCSQSQLQNHEASFFYTNRGGDITYHGPGQLVGYPIIDLENFNISLKDYIFLIEESIIQVLSQWNVKAERLGGATGVWLDVGKSTVRKICAIGVKSSRYVTMHGFAFNINTNLDYFDYINPCGFMDKGVTSLSKELGEYISIEDVKKQVKESLKNQFKFQYL